MPAQQHAAFADDFPEYLIFRSQVIVDLLLPVVDGAGEDEMEQMPRFKNEVHDGPVVVKKDGLASGLG
jgi:hypothetical protein